VLLTLTRIIAWAWQWHVPESDYADRTQHKTLTLTLTNLNGLLKLYLASMRGMWYDPSYCTIIDRALEMTGTPGGKKRLVSGPSDEPAFVDNKSPIKAFKGYPR
jgi:hypothetical protein